jgi:hypothetical protein
VKTLSRGARAFGHFWWDFLIGDAPELFVAAVAIIVLALLLRHERGVAVVVLPLTTVAVLVVSTLRGRRKSSGAP